MRAKDTQRLCNCLLNILIKKPLYMNYEYVGYK